MPDWQELVSILAADLGPDVGLHGDATPPEVAEEYERRFGRVQLVEAIRAALHSDDAQPGSAHRAFCRLSFDTVYTTNFDTLLETAYAEAGFPYRSLVGELQMPFHAGRLGASIIKMHGDLRHEEHMVITEPDYEGFMDSYPVVATHLAAMLIMRTPLFIGYSLSDPDFAQIRRVVRSRLGSFERIAYAIQFDAEPGMIDAALDDNVHVISLDASEGTSREEALVSFFEEVLAHVDERATVVQRDSRPDAFEQLEEAVVRKTVGYPAGSQILEASSKLCFVMMPFGGDSDQVYRSLIMPAVMDAGLRLWRADQISMPGTIVEQVRTSIRQARVCVADITGSNANVLYEVGYAQALEKPLVLLAETTERIPFDVAHLRIIDYGGRMAEARKELRNAVSYLVYSGKLAKADELLAQGQFSGAIAAAAIVLEQHLRQSLSKRAPKDLDRMTLKKLIETARNRRRFSSEIAEQLNEVRQIRNQAVHQVEERTEEEARFVVNVVRKVVALLAVGQEGSDA